MNEEMTVDAELKPEEQELKDRIIRETNKNMKNLLKYPGRVRKIKRLQKQIRNLLVHIEDQNQWIQTLWEKHIEDMARTTKGPHYIYAPKKNHVPIINVFIALVCGLILGGVLF